MMFPMMIAPLSMFVLTTFGAEPSFHYQPPQKLYPAGSFAVSGVPGEAIARIGDKTELKKILLVGVDPSLSLLGTHGVTGDTIWFAPRFPPAPGVEHTIRFDLAVLDGSGAKPKIWQWKPNQEKTPIPRVEAVYPTSETIPENTLRFYIHFSRPMKRGQSPGLVRVLNDQGKEVELAFLELDEELWDSGQTRLTLLVDPGRIKRGVKPLEDVGPVFEAGKTYTLEIGEGFEDEAGKTLGQPYRKSLKVGPAIRERIEPRAWKIVAPQIPYGVLEVHLDRPLDHALLKGQLKLKTTAGAPVEGVWQISQGEKVACFRPFKSWEKGTYHLFPGADLEDAAGNRTNRVFDAPGGEKPVEPVTHLVFTVSGK